MSTDPEAATQPAPEFRMPACWRHFFKGHRWWCRACDREAERQFRDVCEDLWHLFSAPVSASGGGS